MNIKRKCKYCGNKYQPKYSTAEPCPEYECRIKHLEANTAKINRVNKAKAKQELIKQIGGKIDYKKVLQGLVNKIARLIDHEQLCLAKQIAIKKCDGGHVYGRGGHSNMRYNLHNIFAQSVHSNYFQSDDHLMKQGVIREFGVEYSEFVNSLQSTPTPNYTNFEYEAFCSKARLIAKELEKDLRKRSNAERIELRNKYNLQLGIYPTEFLTF